MHIRVEFETAPKYTQLHLAKPALQTVASIRPQTAGLIPQNTKLCLDWQLFCEVFESFGNCSHQSPPTKSLECANILNSYNKHRVCEDCVESVTKNAPVDLFCPPIFHRVQAARSK